MLIDSNIALDSLDVAINWKLRPALDPDRLFDEIASRLHKLFPHLTISQIDLLLADLRRQHAHDMREAEWQVYDGFRTTLGVNDEAA
jgi:hypothetical protein